MDTNKTKIKIAQANQHLATAKTELNRPAEDVVPFMVCRSSRYAISHYLQAFLLTHAVAFEAEDSAEELLKKCLTVDDSFKNLDLRAITFVRDEEYSALFDQMQNCILLAENTKELVTGIQS
jgi:HEPN domain-containing protein